MQFLGLPGEDPGPLRPRLLGDAGGAEDSAATGGADVLVTFAFREAFTGVSGHFGAATYPHLRHHLPTRPRADNPPHP
ncbi:hypothetical protein [Streptomyces sp. 135]|uniref:hypothetical protein n=1 Tax=Streptomyces sp. 135 TaxID=2838850 RepID=UPI001CBEB8CD|nr:hypothetical protein [Streptomyces sp. 135]